MINFTSFSDKTQSIPQVGNTPLYEVPSLAAKYGVDRLWLKDETQNPTGSFKDRAIIKQYETYTKQNSKKFVLSSTGNAAISAAFFARFYPIEELVIYISPTIDFAKLQRLKQAIGKQKNITIIATTKARREALEKSHKGYHNLQASIDDVALQGYEHLGEELMQNRADSIFIPASTGSGALGIYNAYIHNAYEAPGMFLIQTTTCFPLAAKFDTHFKPTDHSLATAINTPSLARLGKREVIAGKQTGLWYMIENTQGFSYAISDKELEEAKKDLETTEPALIKKHDIIVSYDALLSIAGLKKALQYTKKDNHMIPMRPICILTGI